MKFVISGPETDQYKDAVRTLLDGQLPSGWEWVASSANSVVARQLEPMPVYYKEFLSRTPFEGIKNILRGSRCKRAISKGEILRKRGFHTPVVRCWGVREGRHFMVTKGIDALGLGDYISKHWQQTLSRTEISEKRRLIQKLGKKIGELHNNGICHGDLRANNILVQKSAGDIVFYFLDNERNTFYSKIPRRLIRKNLVQLNMIQSPRITRQDRLRFFQAYCDTYAKFSSAEKPAFIERVQRRTAERLAKKAEREKRAGQSDT